MLLSLNSWMILIVRLCGVLMVFSCVVICLFWMFVFFNSNVLVWLLRCLMFLLSCVRMLLGLVLGVVMWSRLVICEWVVIVILLNSVIWVVLGIVVVLIFV